LLVDDIVQRLDHVFLVRQLDFDVDKTVFLAHGAPLLQVKAALCQPPPRQRVDP
jgi:hypothetical protein